jgi:hypothetical protein
MSAVAVATAANQADPGMVPPRSPDTSSSLRCNAPWKAAPVPTT